MSTPRLPFACAEVAHAPFMEVIEAQRRLGCKDPLCPWCGQELTEPEYVDVGVGMQQVTPWVCDGCHAMEIGPYDKREADPTEAECGYYRGRE